LRRRPSTHHRAARGIGRPAAVALAPPGGSHTRVGYVHPAIRFLAQNEPYNGPLPVAVLIAAVAVVVLLAWLYWRSRQ
jgi:hypothetical protein